MQINQEKRNQVSVPEESAPQPKLLEIRRQFTVPVEVLFQAFATAEALKAWWWPNGLHADRIEWDFREGGRYFISMKGQVQGKDAGGGMTTMAATDLDHVRARGRRQGCEPEDGVYPTFFAWPMIGVAA